MLVHLDFFFGFEPFALVAHMHRFNRIETREIFSRTDSCMDLETLLLVKLILTVKGGANL